MKRTQALLFSVAAVTAAAACGGIADPTRTREAPSSSISGTLKGAGGATLSSDTRVAVVWRKGSTNGFVVGADVALANGSFALNLPAPTSDLFQSLESQ